MIEQTAFYEALDKAFKLTFEERNSIYFQIKDQIDNNDSADASRKILDLVINLLKSRSELVEIKAIEKAEGKIPGGVFRRVPQ